MPSELGDWTPEGSQGSTTEESPHTTARRGKGRLFSRNRQRPVVPGYSSGTSKYDANPWAIDRTTGDDWDNADSSSTRGSKYDVSGSNYTGTQGRSKYTWEDDDLGRGGSWLDEEYGGVGSEADPYASDPKPHRRRHQRKVRPRTIALATAGAVLAAGVGIGVPKFLSGGGEQHSRTSISASSTHERHVDPDVASLQKDYADSHAAFKEGGEPFAIGLTSVEQSRYQKYKSEMDTGKALSISDFRDYEGLDFKVRDTAQEVALAQNLAERYDASFKGKVELSTGQKLNFYVINNKADRTVTIDPKALDAYIQWGIAHLADVYQPDGQGDDSARLAKIAEYQRAAKAGKLDNTISIFFNPTPDQCFTKQDIIVPESLSKKINTGNGTTGTETYTNPSCFDLGFNYSGQGTPVIVGLNAINTIETRATQQDPNGPANPLSINGGPATLAVLLHEGVAHTAAQGDGLFPNGENDPPNGFSPDHLQLTNPLTNFAIDFFSHHKPGLDGVPPLPVRVSR